MSKQRTNGPNIPGVQEARAYRSSYMDALVPVGVGAVLGNFAGGTVAGLIMGQPWWFGKPFLTAKSVGVPVHTLIPVAVTAFEHANAPGASVAIYSALAIFLACVVPLGIFGLIRAAKTRDKVLKSDLHGSAHWAARDEIDTAGLLPSKKSDNTHVCYVGGWIDPKSKQQVYLQHSGPEHIITHAPTRSGKGVGLVIPTLLAWQGSVLVHDIKGENHALTAGWRASIGQRILRFSPTEPDLSCRFNPLDEIRIGTEREISDVQNIATMIVDPDGKGLNDHWAKTGYALLVGTILHVLYAKDIKSKTLAAVAALLSNPDVENVNEVFEQMQQYQHDPSGSLAWRDHNGQPTKTHPVVAQAAQEMLNKAPNEKSSVISTAMSFLSLYRDPLVARAIETSDFAIPDLMNDAKPISLYLVVPPSDKDRLKPLVRLILNQVVRRLSEKMEFEGGRSVAKYKHRLLLMIDEFPSLGKLDVFEEALAFIAGYGLKAYLICQDTSQLQKAYGQNESITSNCHIRVYYAPNRIETAKHISEQLGKFTVTSESHQVSYAGSNILPYQTGISSGIQHQARDLMTPDEVMRLRGPDKDGAGNILTPGDMIIVSAGHAPIRGTQILYFLDSTMSRRARIAAPGIIERDTPIEQPEKPVEQPKAPVEASGEQPEAPDGQLETPVEEPDAEVVDGQVDDGLEALPPSPAQDDGVQDDGVQDDEPTDGRSSETVQDDQAAGGLPPADDGLPPTAEDNGQPPVDPDAIMDAAAEEAEVIRKAVQKSGDTFQPTEEAEQRKRDKAGFDELVG